MRVVALKDCYYGEKRRRPGDVFDLESEKDFNPRRMQWTSPRSPLRVSSSPMHLQAQHDQILGAKYAAARGMSTGRDDVPGDLPEGDENPLGD